MVGENRNKNQSIGGAYGEERCLVHKSGQCEYVKGQSMMLIFSHLIEMYVQLIITCPLPL